MNILFWGMNVFFLISENHYHASPGSLYKGCAIGDDIISHSLSGAIVIRSEPLAAVLCLRVLYLEQIKFNLTSVISAGQTKKVFLEDL